MPTPAQILKAVGHDIKGASQNRSNSAGPRSNIQGGGAVGAIYGSDIWVVTSKIQKFLIAFHHQSVQRIIEMTAKLGAGGECDIPLVDEAMEVVGIHPIEVYMKRRYTTKDERVACLHVYALCTEEERILGMIWLVQWWYQDTVNELK